MTNASVGPASRYPRRERRATWRVCGGRGSAGPAAGRAGLTAGPAASAAGGGGEAAAGAEQPDGLGPRGPIGHITLSRVLQPVDAGQLLPEAVWILIIDRAPSGRDAVMLAACARPLAAAFRLSVWPRPGPAGQLLEPARFSATRAPGAPAPLQAALDALPPGGALLLLPGVHVLRSELRIEREVHIWGREAATLELELSISDHDVSRSVDSETALPAAGASSGPTAAAAAASEYPRPQGRLAYVVRATAPRATLAGVAVRGGSVGPGGTGSGAGAGGGVAIQSGGLRLQHCKISGCATAALFVAGSIDPEPPAGALPTVANTALTDNPGVGLRMATYCPAGFIATVGAGDSGNHFERNGGGDTHDLRRRRR